MFTDLGTGTIRASFHASGKVLVVKDRLNNLVRLGTMASTDPLSILADMPSGPVDLEGSRLTVRLQTSASLHKSSGGQSAAGKRKGGGESRSGGDLKQSQKKVFRSDAYSLLSETSTPLESRVGIEQSCLFNSLMDFQKSLEFWDRSLRKYLALLSCSMAVTRFLVAQYF